MATVQDALRTRTDVLDDKLYEVVDGQRIEPEPASAYATLLASALTYFFTQFALDRKLGLVATEALFVLDAARGLQRRPDVALVCFSRWTEANVPNTAAWNVVPDLAVEVVSPSNLAEEVDAKTIEYFNAGVRLVWVIYPESQRVYVHQSPRQIEVVERSGELTGGDVMPGFRLPVQKLFDAVRRPE